MFEALASPKAAADGSRPQAFHVIAPSLPGYGFSSAPRQPGFGVEKIAQTFDALMSALGYQTYVAQGARNALCLVPSHERRYLGARLWGPCGAASPVPPSTARTHTLSVIHFTVEMKGSFGKFQCNHQKSIGCPHSN